MRDGDEDGDEQDRGGQVTLGSKGLDAALLAHREQLVEAKAAGGGDQLDGIARRRLEQQEDEQGQRDGGGADPAGEVGREPRPQRPSGTEAIPP
jgi:hypothetical protein